MEKTEQLREQEAIIRISNAVNQLWNSELLLLVEDTIGIEGKKAEDKSKQM